MSSGRPISDYLDLIEGPGDPTLLPGRLEGLNSDDVGRISAMRRDRAMLASLPALAAPPDLLEGVAARLERAALLAIADGETVDPIATVPQTIVVRRRLGWRGPLLGALAATVLIASGAAIFFSLSRHAPSGGPEIAAHDGESAPITPDSPQADPGPQPGQDSEPPETVIAAVDPEPAPIIRTIPTPDFAAYADLIRQGRLAIRLRTADQARAESRLAQFSTPSGRLDWHILGAVDVALVAEITARPPFIAGQDRPLAVAAWAGTEPQAMIFSAEAPLPAPTLQPRIRSVFGAEIDPTGASVESLLRALTVGDNDRVIVVELDEPITAPPPSLDPSRVMWWLLPPSEWGRPAFIPIAVETLE